jgi:hypothetical protein
VPQTSLDDLLDFGSSLGSTQTTIPTQPNTVDLIGDLLGGGHGINLSQ